MCYALTSQYKILSAFYALLAEDIYFIFYFLSVSMSKFISSKNCFLLFNIYDEELLKRAKTIIFSMCHIVCIYFILYYIEVPGVHIYHYNSRTIYFIVKLFFCVLEMYFQFEYMILL